MRERRQIVLAVIGWLLWMNFPLYLALMELWMVPETARVVIHVALAFMGGTLISRVRCPYPTRRLKRLGEASRNLAVFLAAATVQLVWFLTAWLALCPAVFPTGRIVITAIVSVVLLAGLFWWNMIAIYLTSVQLGLKHRVLAALCGWIPGLNIWYLTKMIRITAQEAEFETEKWELDTARAESEICKTRYPILMVHGVFFRDYRFLNYWGRIPPGNCSATVPPFTTGSSSPLQPWRTADGSWRSGFGALSRKPAAAR